MERLLMQELAAWKTSDDRKPLILRGALGTGKTWLAREFGRRYFKNTAYVSFAESSRMKRAFEEGHDLRQLLMDISAESHVEILPQETLIIFDEIQECPKALEALKDFYERAPDCPVVAAGSYLGLTIQQGISYPVGEVTGLTLYPLNFREFLLAAGESHLERVLSKGDTAGMLELHEKYLFWLRNYLYVGGMPAAVEYFVRHPDYEGVRKIQLELLDQYREAFDAYAVNKALVRMNLLWDSLPAQLSKKNKKFFFNQAKKNGRMTEFESALEWLWASGFLYMVPKVEKPLYPLEDYADAKACKLYPVDVGLLSAMLGMDSRMLLEGEGIFTENSGALSEQFVIQQLLSDGGYEPFYYVSENGTYGVDFLVQQGEKVIPLAVKPSENQRARGLRVYMDRYDPEKAIKLSAAPRKEQGSLTNLPLYAVHLLDNH